jgi:hypothetical protein
LEKAKSLSIIYVILSLIVRLARELMNMEDATNVNQDLTLLRNIKEFNTAQ